jgi:hypothetical protein
MKGYLMKYSFIKWLRKNKIVLAHPLNEACKPIRRKTMLLAAIASDGTKAFIDAKDSSYVVLIKA